MSYEKRPIDITKVKATAIVNSLGVEAGTYGQICESIVANVDPNHTWKIKQDITKMGENCCPGKIEITGSYGLENTKYIVHVFTPYYKNDKQFYGLEYVYKCALLCAVKNKWSSIALPIIGTGYNGYPSSVVYTMLEKLVAAFSKVYPKMKVIICTPVKKKEDYAKKFDPVAIKKQMDDFIRKYSPEGIRDFIYDEDSFKNIKPNEMERYLTLEGVVYRGKSGYNGTLKNKESLFIDEIKVILSKPHDPIQVDFSKLPMLTIIDYVNEYIELRFSNEYDRKTIMHHVRRYISNDNDENGSYMKKLGDEKKRNTTEIKTLMRIIIALEMNVQEAEDFLKYCSKAFSPASKVDNAYLEIIKNKYFSRTEANEYCQICHLAEKDYIFNIDE